MITGNENEMISRVDHVSIAVQDYEKAVDFYRKLAGAIPGASGSDSRLQFEWMILSTGDLSRLELIHPTGANSFLKKFLADKEGGVHHITFETPDIHLAKARLDQCQIPYFGFNDQDPHWKDLFIHPKDAFGVLIQIAQLQPDEWLAPSVTLPAGQKWTAEKSGETATLSLAHPGGGKMKTELSKKEVERLVEDLQQILSDWK